MPAEPFPRPDLRDRDPGSSALPHARTPGVGPSPFHRIAVGVDDRGLADDATLAAVELAGRLGASVELVHAVRTRRPHWSRVDRGWVERDSRFRLRRAERAVTERLAGVLRRSGRDDFPLSERLVLREGSPARVLLELGDQTDVDLLVVGPHARRRALDFGSTLRALLAHAKVPIWSQADAFAPVETILCPVDFSPDSRRSLDLGLALAAKLGARVRVLHGFTPPWIGPTGEESESSLRSPTYVIDMERDEARARLDAIVEEVGASGVEVEGAFVETYLPEEAVDAQEGVDLTVIGTHGHSALSQYLLGSVAYQVLRSVSPVVVVPPLARRSARWAWETSARDGARPAAQGTS